MFEEEEEEEEEEKEKVKEEEEEEKKKKKKTIKNMYFVGCDFSDLSSLRIEAKSKEFHVSNYIFNIP